MKLDDDLRQALQARDGPPPGAHARNLAALRAKLGGPSGPLDDGGGGLEAGVGASQAPITGMWMAKVAGATLGLTAAGLVALGLGAAAFGGEGAGEAEVVAVASAAGPELAGADSRAPEPSASAAASPAAARSEPALDADPTDPSKSAARSPKPKPKPESSAETGTDNTLDAELALIGAAKRERDAAPKAALTKLDEHAASFPAGVLAPEREALRIELLCGLDRGDEAVAAAARFHQTHGASPLRQRFEAACEAAGVSLAGAGAQLGD